MKDAFHDLNNALVCVRRVADLLPVIGDFSQVEIETLQDELRMAVARLMKDQEELVRTSPAPQD